MSKLVKIEALPRPGIQYAFTPSYVRNDKGALVIDEPRGRGWPCGTPVTVEVLDQDHDGPLIETMVMDRHRGHEVKRQVPDMDRIGRATYDAVKASPFIRVLEDASVSNDEASRALEVAKKQALDATQRVLELERQLATLGAENKDLKKERDDLRASLDQALAPATKVETTKTVVDPKTTKASKGA
jgi:hypothetical protein